MFASLTECHFSDVLKAFNEGFSDYLVPVNMTKEQLRQKIEREKLDVNHSFAYLVDGNIAGVILTGISEFHGVKQMWIGGMAVVPAYRSKGIAKKLLQHVEAEARANDCSELLLEVITENRKAYRLYQEFGFEQLNELVVGKVMPFSFENETVLTFKASSAVEQATYEPVAVPWQTRLDKQATVISIWEKDNQVGYLSILQDPTKVRILQVEVFDQERTDLVPSILQQVKLDYKTEEVWIYNLVASSMAYEQIEQLGLVKPLRQDQIKLQTGKA